MARWHSCNVLETAPDRRRIWKFEGGSFKLDREHTASPGEPLPPHLVGKSWSSLWQKKLNVAWLPPENVFIRVAQFPQSTPDETRAMVELQLEKLSPIPVTQAVWSMHAFPHAGGSMQTVIVLIVARTAVEEFLGRIEGEGYLADRLELPLLDQLQAMPAHEDGAWIYPSAAGGRNSAVVAWWYGGVLQNVDFLSIADTADRAAGMRDQLTQMAWAGELEGWLTSPPNWHLVADDATAAEWSKSLQEGLGVPIPVEPPVPAQQLAARTARRAAESDPKFTLLPPEFVVRYRQQFVDRLWMRGLGAVLAVYVVGLIIYFAALAVLNYKTTAVETQAAAQAPAYTNSIRLAAELKVLTDRQELKYAALDSWLAVAEALPPSITLESLDFSGGKNLRLNGTAPADQVAEIIDFSDKLRKTVIRGQSLFGATQNDPPRITQVGGTVARWSYELELKRTGE